MSDDDITNSPRVTATDRTRDATSSATESFELSATQRAIWFEQQLLPESIRSHISTAVRVMTDADPDVVRQVFADVVRDHESLRTTFHDHDGTPRQRIGDESMLEFRYFDAQEWSDEEFTAELVDAHRHPFDLVAGPPVRFRVFRRGPAEHVAVIAIHHIVADMWSQALLGYTVAAAFERATSSAGGNSDDSSDGASKRLARRRSWTYRDFVEHERAHIDSAEGSAAIEFWRDLFESWRPQSVPDDRPETGTSIGSGDAVSLALDPSLVERMRTFANDRETSVRALVLLGYQVALARTTDSSDVVVAETKATRNLRMTNVIGCCINQIPRRLRFDEATTSEQAVASHEEHSRASRPHDTVPFEHLLHQLRPGHGTEPFFQAAFAWQKTTRVVSEQLSSNLALGTSGATVDLAGLQVAPMPMPTRSAPFPMTLLAAANGDDINLTFEFQSNRFDRDTVERFGRRVHAAIEHLVDEPENPIAAIDLSTEAERERWQASWESVRYPLDESVAVHHLIAQRAADTPSAIAVRFADDSLTYAELERRAGRLAQRLTRSGVQVGDLVGICQDRSIDLLVSILAAWKAGAGYVPMDPGFPVERLGVMLSDADISRVVTRSPLWGGVCDAAQNTPAASVFDQAVVIDLDATADVDETSISNVHVDGTGIAYVTFTSGSTGRPKGVVVEHRSVVNFAQAMARRPGIDAADTVLATTTLSFDISVLELIVPLVIGATVDLVDRETARDPLLLATALDRVTIAQGTPTMWKMLIDFGWRGNPDLTVLCGGEPLPLALAQSLQTRCHTLWNMYGPTETTVWSSVERVDAPVERVSIGRPIDNTRLVVLDAHQRRCPDGVAGELWIGGAGVTQGYIGRPELTAERFVPDPLGEAHGTLYRTGDLVRRAADGGIEFLGRIDNQVKVRGHRIELGEIEAAIERNPRIVQCVAAVRDFGEGDQRIVAYYRLDPDDENRPDGDDENGRRRVDLREHARLSLPDYMVPSVFVRVDAFPRTPNDKIDRDRLPTPDGVRHDTESASTQPTVSTAHLTGVLGAYRAVFGDDQIGDTDDFFDLGGHSLLATRLVSRLRHSFGREIMLRSVFEHPTPLALASIVRSAPPARPNPNMESFGLAPPSGSLRGQLEEHDTPAGDPRSHFPLSSSQERMWFLQQLNPDGVAYNLSGIVRIEGRFDIGLLQRAFDRVVERHTSLRSRFELYDGSPVVTVDDPFQVDIVVIDRRHEGDRSANVAAAKAGIQRDAEIPFDLTKPPLFRVTAHRTADDELLLGLTFHHIIADQWAFGVLAHELSTLIRSEQRGEPATLRPAPRAELYSQWQRSEMQPSVEERLLTYWLSQLHGLKPLELEPDHPRPTSMTGRGASITMTLPSNIVEAVRATARANQLSEFMVEFAAFQLHLHRATGATDLAVGVPIANRHWLESESLITTLVNTLVLRNDLSVSADFTDLLDQVRDTTLDAYAHQDLPFERLIEAMAPPRDPSRSPLFQIFFNAQNAPFELPDIEGFAVDIIAPERRAAQFDLSVTIDSALTNTITLEYATDLFEEPRMERFLQDYVQLLADVSGPHGGSTPVSSQARRVVDSSPQQTAAPSVRPEGREAPRAGLERRVAELWERVLGASDISRDDDFFALGGHSIVAVRIFAELSEMIDDVGDRPPLSLLFSAPTVASFAAALESGGWSTPWTSLVEVSAGRASASGRGATPFFYVSPFLITALSFHELADRIGGRRPFYAFQPQGLENDEPVHQLVEDMAEHYITEMKTVQPTGPYLIGGHCAGGWVAFEMARQLEAGGDEVSELVIVDVEPPGVERPPVRWLSYVASRVVIYGMSHRLMHALRWRFSIWRSRKQAQRVNTSTSPNEHLVRDIHRQAHERYEGGTYRGDLTLIRSQEWSLLPDKRWHDQWHTLTSGAFRAEIVPGAHARLLDGDGVRDLAVVLRRQLDRHR